MFLACITVEVKTFIGRTYPKLIGESLQFGPGHFRYISTLGLLSMLKTVEHMHDGQQIIIELLISWLISELTSLSNQTGDVVHLSFNICKLNAFCQNFLSTYPEASKVGYSLAHSFVVGHRKQPELRHPSYEIIHEYLICTLKLDELINRFDQLLEVTTNSFR